ncbi:MAG: DUF6447 family protein [Cyanobium sp.]
MDPIAQQQQPPVLTFEGKRYDLNSLPDEVKELVRGMQVATGGEAKLRIQRGDVRVNGAIETRRGRQLAVGEAVGIDGRELLVVPLQRPG